MLKIKGKKVNKGKTLSVTCQEAQSESYSSTVSLTSALGGVGGQRHASVALPPVLIVQVVGWAPGDGLDGCTKISTASGFDTQTV